MGINKYKYCIGPFDLLFCTDRIVDTLISFNISNLILSDFIQSLIIFWRQNVKQYQNINIMDISTWYHSIFLPGSLLCRLPVFSVYYFFWSSHFKYVQWFLHQYDCWFGVKQVIYFSDLFFFLRQDLIQYKKTYRSYSNIDQNH